MQGPTHSGLALNVGAVAGALGLSSTLISYRWCLSAAGIGDIHLEMPGDTQEHLGCKPLAPPSVDRPEPVSTP